MNRAALRAVGAAALLWLLALATAGPARGEPAVIRWMVRDVPPHFSYRDGRPPQRPADLGRGEIDGFLRLLIEQLPQYRHEFVDAGFSRFEALVRQGQTLCSPLHVRTPERLSWLYFTHVHPPLFSRQIHLVVRRELAPQLEALGASVQLADFLQQTELRGLLPRDRSFGPRIDALLYEQAFLAPKTIVAGRHAHLLAMLLAQRMDYTFEYPSAVDEYLRSSRQPPDALFKLPIQEGASTQQATFACSRNAEGRSRIEAIDQAVRRMAADPQREAWIQLWRGKQIDEPDRQRIRRYMDERARGGPQID